MSCVLQKTRVELKEIHKPVVISINMFISKKLNRNISISNGIPLLTKTLQVIVGLWYQRLEIIFLVLPQYMSLKKEMQI